ncbi:MAG: ribosome biogenesis GTP-binding protein YihA/YsxC [Negativicutes bacterium]|jgi:GTP-binding protein
MDIIKAEFIKSATAVAQLPEEPLNEFAFIGRSNVGKSSLINSLCRHNGLARVSATPGKTALINYFKVTIKNESVREYVYFVDLPGYGYAKTSKSNRETWSEFINAYIGKSAWLKTVFLLIDSRREPQKLDLEACGWLKSVDREVVLVLTKTDKLTKNQLATNVRAIINGFAVDNDHIVKYSTVTKIGRAELIKMVYERINHD